MRPDGFVAGRTSSRVLVVTRDGRVVPVDVEMRYDSRAARLESRVEGDTVRATLRPGFALGFRIVNGGDDADW